MKRPPDGDASDATRQAAVRLRTGRIASVMPEAGYGFIEARGGEEVYFHVDDVLDARVEDLHVGDEVRYRELIARGRHIALLVTPLHAPDGTPPETPQETA